MTIHSLQTCGAVSPNSLRMKFYGGGDFNTCLDVKVDRMGSGVARHRQSTDALLGLLEAGNLLDVWRLRHPEERESTFISTVHGTWSCLDYWLLSEVACPCVGDVSHLANTLSDHSPVLLEMSIPECERPPFTWRLQQASLTDPVFKCTVGEAIHNYFKENEGTVDSAGSFGKHLRSRSGGLYWCTGWCS